MVASPSLKSELQWMGIRRQYTGWVGKITHYQIRMFTADVSDKGDTFVDRALHRQLP